MLGCEAIIEGGSQNTKEYIHKTNTSATDSQPYLCFAFNVFRSYTSFTGCRAQYC